MFPWHTKKAGLKALFTWRLTLALQFMIQLNRHFMAYSWYFYVE